MNCSYSQPRTPHLLTLALMLGVVAGCTSTSTRPAQAELRVGTSGDYPPFSDWKEERPSGFSVALVERFAAEHALQPSWVRFRWPELVKDLEAGRFDWQIAAVDMKGVVREAIATTSQLFKDRAVTLDARLPDGLPAARADRDQIMQVTLNLLSNAVKFSPQGAGRVVVELARSDGGIQVSVGDNGPGIAPGSHRMIFEKFRQVGDTLTAKPSGTGLGLAICRRIVEHLGGRIWFESELGRGATFRFVIPLAEPQPAMASAAK